jgi:primosomal protein N'
VTTCLHSTIPDEKKADIWNLIREDKVSVVVGTRSAVFLPLPSIGLIWIDREEDPALKEPMEPRYHARDVAWMRAREEQALLVLSSAHLSLEATVQAPQHVLRASVPREATPYIEVVDLRRHDRTVLLSPTLIQAMREAIVRQAGVLLFLNRKAYAGALVCRDCGQVPRCRSCTVALAYSRQKRSVFCHYCGAADAIPDLCAACGGPRLHPIGEGTERVEEEVKRQFPLARILRVDGETMRRAKDAAAMGTGFTGGSGMSSSGHNSSCVTMWCRGLACWASCKPMPASAFRIFERLNARIIFYWTRPGSSSLVEPADVSLFNPIFPHTTSLRLLSSKKRDASELKSWPTGKRLAFHPCYV